MSKRTHSVTLLLTDEERKFLDTVWLTTGILPCESIRYGYFSKWLKKNGDKIVYKGRPKFHTKILVDDEERAYLDSEKVRQNAKIGDLLRNGALTEFVKKRADKVIGSIKIEA